VRNAGNYGFARANNLGIARATGRHLLFLNPDVRFDSNPIPALLAGLESDAHLGVVSPLLYGEDGRPQIAGYFMAFPSLLQLILKDTLLARLPRIRDFVLARYSARIAPSGWSVVDQAPGAFLLFRRDLPIDRPFLDERFFIWMEDVDFCKRVADAGLHVAVNASVRAVHTGGVSFAQVGSALKRRRYRTSYLAYLRKHFPSGRRLCAMAILSLDSVAVLISTFAWNLARGRFSRALSLARAEAGVLMLTLGDLAGLPSRKAKDA